MKSKECSPKSPIGRLEAHAFNFAEAAPLDPLKSLVRASLHCPAFQYADSKSGHLSLKTRLFSFKLKHPDIEISLTYPALEHSS